MKMSIYGVIGRPTTGTPAPGFLGAAAWRVRQIHGTKSVSSLLVTDVPVNKPLYVSASERCP